MRAQTFLCTKSIGQFPRHRALCTSTRSSAKSGRALSQAAHKRLSCKPSVLTCADWAQPMTRSSQVTGTARDNKSDQENVPAPWKLQGDAFLLPTLQTSLIKQYTANPLPGGKHWGLVGGIILARYHDTSVGPYSELIFSSGLYRLGSRHVGFHVDQIYVDSQLSLLGGRLNWAVPKKLADFDWQVQDQLVQVKVSLPGRSQPFLTASFNESKLHIPASLAVVPSPFKSILQARNEQQGDSAANKYISTRVTAAGSLHALSTIKVQTDNNVVPGSEELGIWRTGISLTGFDGTFGKPTDFKT